MRMKLQTTALALLICGLGAATVVGQDREDALYVRFMQESESITIDGDLSDPAWANAEVLNIEYGTNAGIPGSGWFVQNLGAGISEPGDPPSGTVRYLAKGDSLYLAFEIEDESVGGNPNLWSFDGIFMPLGDWTEFGPTTAGFRHFPATDEFMYVWWNATDTTATGAPMPGISPRRHSHDARYGKGSNRFSTVDSMYTAEQRTNWEAVTVVDGTANDDTHGADNGYIMEMRINMEPLGFDIDGAGGDVVPMGLAIQDADWYWGGNADESATSRAWFQSQWGNFVSGVARLVFDPSVTTAGEPLNSLAPDVIIPNGDGFDAAVVDGVLDDEVWMHSTPGLQMQYQNEEMIMNWPGVTPLFSGYFNPADEAVAPPVVDPNLNDIYWHFNGDWLYLGVDVMDQAVDTTRSEGGDGIRFTINDRDSVNADNWLFPHEFIVAVGPDGEPRLDGAFGTLDPSVFEVDVSLKGATTAADPSDVDEGYQIEIAIDLVNGLGYPAGRGDGALFITAHAFDHDVFEDEANNYNARIWWSRERGAGVPAWGFMDVNTPVNVATETTTELPEGIRLEGNYPNPFNPSTTLRFAIPETGEVTVRVYDLLGRSIRTLVMGQQSAGMQQVQFTASDLASGTYFYRVELKTAAGNVIQSAAERMVLLK